MTDILDGEVVDDLQINGLRIIQKASGFKFGIDAVLLSDFARDTKSKATLDLCTGCGIVPLLLSAKTRTPYICGLEIQRDICDTAKRSVALNSLEERVHITEGDLKNAAEIYGKAVFDKITCNPPYMKLGAGVRNDTDTKSAARHEILCTLEDVINAAASLLIPFGHFYMVHRPNRIADIMCCMRKYKIEPKRLRFVCPNAAKPPNLLLVEGVKGGGSDMKILPNLYVYNSDGTHTEEINKIYGFPLADATTNN
ncbi:MAG: tRNA1(Val) (adenine(37)-N6)-methyltransferase [Firmicutes bacterium]|nr:tRNA1(Val) (adenine(37)-N6)-methyltransferase [Bacillota bacterium]